MQVSSNQMRNRHRESICVFTHSGPVVDNGNRQNCLKNSKIFIVCRYA